MKSEQYFDGGIKLAWGRPKDGTVKSKCGRVTLSRCVTVPPNPEGWCIYMDCTPIGGRSDAWVGSAKTMGEAKVKANKLLQQFGIKKDDPTPRSAPRMR